MKRCGLILLLLSGYVMVCHLQSDQLVRQLYLVNLQKSWNDAQQYCRNEYIDLAIANSSALIQEAQNRVGNTEAWIGLSEDSWSWSQTGPVQSSWFSSWALGQPGNDDCVTIFGSGSWFTKPCSYSYCFVCYDAKTNSHNMVTNSATWFDAQAYCRQKYTDLSTITNSSDNNQVAETILGYMCWIGLSKSGWSWSQTGPVQSSWFHSWAPGHPWTWECVTIIGSGSWFTAQCSTLYYFVCYDAKTNSHNMVTNFMTWSDARAYCRQTYTDLSTITNSSDNNQVAKTTLGYMCWIGLYRNDWMWSNSSTASLLPWGPWQPDSSGNCATIDGSTGYFHSHDCNDRRPFVCYTDVKSSASRSVKAWLRAGSADLNDPTVQESILQQVREKLVEQGIIEEVKLRWKTQPDGKIFHRQEETAPPGYREMKDCGSV